MSANPVDAEFAARVLELTAVGEEDRQASSEREAAGNLALDGCVEQVVRVADLGAEDLALFLFHSADAMVERLLAVIAHSDDPGLRLPYFAGGDPLPVHYFRTSVVFNGGSSPLRLRWTVKRTKQGWATLDRNSTLAGNRAGEGEEREDRGNAGGNCAGGGSHEVPRS